jgi:hypothetical protein
MRRGFAHILLILIVIALIGGGAWLWKTHPEIFTRFIQGSSLTASIAEPKGLVAGSVKEISGSSLVLSGGLEGSMKKIDGKYDVREITWQVATDRGTKILRRTFRDPKAYNAEVIAYHDKQAQGTASGPAPLLYNDEAFAFSAIKKGYNVNVYTKTVIATGTPIAASDIAYITVFPLAAPAASAPLHATSAPSKAPTLPSNWQSFTSKPPQP